MTSISKQCCTICNSWYVLFLRLGKINKTSCYYIVAQMHRIISAMYLLCFSEICIQKKTGILQAYIKIYLKNLSWIHIPPHNYFECHWAINGPVLSRSNSFLLNTVGAQLKRPRGHKAAALKLQDRGKGPPKKALQTFPFAHNTTLISMLSNFTLYVYKANNRDLYDLLWNRGLRSSLFCITKHSKQKANFFMFCLVYAILMYPYALLHRKKET